MDEIEYKLTTSNSVLVVNAIDKLISAIKSKYKPGERKKIVLENEELKYLRDKCSSKDRLVSLTACQGLLALVELGVLEIGHTMSTVVTLLPSAHNYSAIISTMAGLLILDLKSRLIPGQLYKCQFSLKSPQHPFITVLEKTKDAEDEVLTQMHALCTHPDYIVSSNSLELLRPVFFWMMCNPQHCGSTRSWQLLLSLSPSVAQADLLLTCISCQLTGNGKQTERALSAYSAVSDSKLHQGQHEYAMALLPGLARISNALTAQGADPRACYVQAGRAVGGGRSGRAAAALAVALLAADLRRAAALHLHELFNLCLNLITKNECSSISISTFVALSLQWLHLPSYLTSSALKMASQILTIHRNQKEDATLYTPNLKANDIFKHLMYTDADLYITFHFHQTWEKVREDRDKMRSWLDSLERVDGLVKLELVPFLLGLTMEKRKQSWFEEIVLRCIKIVVSLLDVKKELSVQLLPVLVYKIANDPSPSIKIECLKALPLMAKTKENVPTIVSVLNKIKSNKGAPLSFIIMLYTTLAETQVRCFPYLKEVLTDNLTVRPDDLKWELDIAKAVAVKKICDIRPSTQGLELVPVISSILNRCTDRAGGLASSIAVQALAALWRGAAVSPPSTWKALEPKLGKDTRPAVIISLCRLLGEVPTLRVTSPEYEGLVGSAAARLWGWVAAGDTPEVVVAACEALAEYKVEDYTLKDIPEIYRKTVKLPQSYCKTPADAARRPEDVLDYVPCEVWPEVYKFTNQAALSGVERLLYKLIEREVRGFRSGVYQPEARAEPASAGYLQASSVLRGVMDTFKKQVTSPSYEYSDIVLLSMLSTLTMEYPRPLPPLDLVFLHEALHRGSAWKRGCCALAARQASTSGSGLRLVQNYLHEIQPDTAPESDTMLIFELLPILCRNLPPNTIRPVLERCLSHSYVNSSTDDKDSVFVQQIDLIRVCLENEKIHDANRTLLSQILERYYDSMSEDHAAWSSVVCACARLPLEWVERVTSPGSWWGGGAREARRAGALRARAAHGSLAAMSELVDEHVHHPSEHSNFLECMASVARAADPALPATRDWFLQLMARTQLAFNESEVESGSQLLMDVFSVSAIVLSGAWSFEPDWRVGSRARMLELLPAALVLLFRRPLWEDNVLLVCEWALRAASRVRGPAAQSCHRAALALRAQAPSVWTKLNCDLKFNIEEDE